jgi:cytochrome c553
MIPMRRGWCVWTAAVGLAVAATLAGARPAAAQEDGDGADLERGEELFALCAQCHGDAGAGNIDIQAPAIAGLPAWYVDIQLHKFRKGWRGGHPDDVAGMRMKPMSMWLSGDEDIQAVAAYVASLPAADPPRTLDGSAERGRAFYAPCLACHGPAGTGNEAIKSPPLVHAADWYLLSQLRKFKAKIRGWTPEDANGQVMVGMAQTLADEQAMKDVIAHIMTLRSE